MTARSLIIESVIQSVFNHPKGPGTAERIFNWGDSSKRAPEARLCRVVCGEDENFEI